MEKNNKRKPLLTVNMHHTPICKYELEKQKKKIEWWESYIKALEKLKY